jgi:membrane-associated phospholipid phosphatase
MAWLIAPRESLHRASVILALTALVSGVCAPIGRAEARPAPVDLHALELEPRPLTSSLFSRRSAVLLLAGGAIAAASVPGEDPDFAAVSLDQGPFEALADPGNVFGSGAASASVALGLLAAGRSTGREDLWGAGQDMTRAVVLSGALVAGTKVLVGRTRPNGGAYSFPSGHTANAFTMATVLDAHFGHRVGLPAFALACGTALGRMEDRKHYLSDVVFGASVGLAVGLAVSESSTSRFRPQLDVRGSRAGLTVHF